jgi:uncharacterized protein involved in exopolysaccharide biosynthesis
VTDLPTNPEKGGIEPHEPDEILLESVDEQQLRDARERMAARVRVLWLSRKFLVWTTFLGLVLATAIAFLMPKSYKSTAELMPPNGGLGSGATMLAALSSRIGGGLAGLAENALGIKTTGALFIGILKSDTVRDDLIQKFDLQRVYGTHYLQDTRRALAGNTDISEDEKSGLVTISVSDRDPQRAAAMAQEYVNQLNWVVTHLSTSSAHRERVFLDQRLKQVRASLELSEKQFSEFASKKGAIDIPTQGKAMVTAAATLQGELIAAESELQGLRQVFTSNNVRVRTVQARVDELRSSLRKLAGRGSSDQSSALQLYPSLRELPILGVTYADLLRRVKVEETIFEILTEQDELAKVQEAKEVPSVRVLDPPLVPKKKSFPPRLLIMLLGTMLAFVFAATWILGNSAWQAVDPTDPRKVIAIEVWSDLHARWPFNGRNGWHGDSKGRQFLKKFGRKQK